MSTASAAPRARAGGRAISFCDDDERELLRDIEKLTRLNLPKIDRRGAAGPKPAPVLRKAASAAALAPAPKRPHHSPHRDNRGAVAFAGKPRPVASSGRLSPAAPRSRGVNVKARR